eukprot:COSAG05_NODE_7930_length_754_cov_1.741985_1_plen_122_part_00
MEDACRRTGLKAVPPAAAAPNQARVMDTLGSMVPGLRNRNAAKKKRLSMPMNTLATSVERTTGLTSSAFADSNLAGGKVTERIRRQSDVSTYMHPGSNTFIEDDEDMEDSYEFPCVDSEPS